MLNYYLLDFVVSIAICEFLYVDFVVGVMGIFMYRFFGRNNIKCVFER